MIVEHKDKYFPVEPFYRKKAEIGGVGIHFYFVDWCEFPAQLSDGQAESYLDLLEGVERVTHCRFLNSNCSAQKVERELKIEKNDTSWRSYKSPSV